MDRGTIPDRPDGERAAQRADSPPPEGIPGDANPAGAEGAAPADPAAEAAAAAAAAAAQVQLYVDRLQRLQADFDNFRRRSLQESREREDRTLAQVFRRLLPVIDDLRLAARAEEKSDEGITEGLRIILDKVAALLGEFSIEEIAAVGQPFDPKWHEALAHQASESAPPGVILDEYERGYRLRDLLVRPARVIVARSPGPGDESTG